MIVTGSAQPTQTTALRSILKSKKTQQPSIPQPSSPSPGDLNHEWTYRRITPLPPSQYAPLNQELMNCIENSKTSISQSELSAWISERAEIFAHLVIFFSKIISSLDIRSPQEEKCISKTPAAIDQLKKNPTLKNYSDSLFWITKSFAYCNYIKENNHDPHWNAFAELVKNFLTLSQPLHSWKLQPDILEMPRQPSSTQQANGITIIRETTSCFAPESEGISKNPYFVCIEEFDKVDQFFTTNATSASIPKCLKACRQLFYFLNKKLTKLSSESDDQLKESNALINEAQTLEDLNDCIPLIKNFFEIYKRTNTDKRTDYYGSFISKADKFFEDTKKIIKDSGSSITTASRKEKKSLFKISLIICCLAAAVFYFVNFSK